jgi:hypothetical protein
MESCVMMNEGNVSFKITPLPDEAQFSPVYAIDADDYDNDNHDIILGEPVQGQPVMGLMVQVFLSGEE